MKQNPIRQVVFPILAALIWGTAFVAQDVCADTIGAFTFNAARYAIAVLALLVLIAVLNAVHKDRPQPHRSGKTRCTQAALARRLLLRHGAGHRLELPAGPASSPERMPERRGFLTALYVVLVPGVRPVF